MSIHDFIKIKGLNKKSKRIGRGYGSNKGGHTVGRGAKGQKARSKVPLGFEGGQVPLYKRLPRLNGFSNIRSKDILSIGVGRLNVFKSGEKVTPGKLVEAGVIKKVPKYGVKILATGTLEKKLEISGFSFSENARSIIEKSGSSIK